MKIEVLGSGCPKCEKLYRTTEEAVKAFSSPIELLKVEDISRMVELGMWSTPGLAIDGKVVMTGRVPSAEEIKKIIDEHS